MNPALELQLSEKSAQVDAALEAFLRAGAQVENLHDGMLYALGLDNADPLQRGKRIRPALCLMTCEALGGDTKLAMPFAMAVELMHNFFLVHDDIEDGDAYRRGRPSVWKKYGLAHGINIGDFLYTQVFASFLSARRGAYIPSGLRVALLELLVETLERTHVGQALDINALARDQISINQYMEIVTNKTGYYLAAPMLGGALTAGADEDVLHAVRQLGRHVGPVFQIVDDTIDLTHGKGRESIGSDIREGKRSFLVAHASACATREERHELFRVLDLPREETKNEHIEWTLALFRRHASIKAGQALCRDLMEKAREAMKNAPAQLRDTLLGIFDALLDRER